GQSRPQAQTLQSGSDGLGGKGRYGPLPPDLDRALRGLLQRADLPLRRRVRVDRRGPDEEREGRGRGIRLPLRAPRTGGTRGAIALASAPFAVHAACLTSATIFLAASPRSSALTIGRPELLRISLPFSTLVPSRRTTSGTERFTSLAAATMPS